jgi:hypothetical protein
LRRKPDQTGSCVGFKIFLAGLKKRRDPKGFLFLWGKIFTKTNEAGRFSSTNQTVDWVIATHHAPHA